MDTTPIPQSTPSGAPAPKKYIRTFEGDMETYKKGGDPDLKPFDVPQIHVAPPLPLHATDEPSSLRLAKSEAPVAPKSESPPIPIKSVPPPAPAVPPPTSTAGRLETYESDFHDRVKTTDASITTILAAEQDSAVKEPTPEVKSESGANTLYIVAGIILLLVGGVGAYVAYSTYLTKVAPITLAPMASAPIFVDERDLISGATAAEILQAIEQSVADPLAQNTVRLLYLDSATSTVRSVFSELSLSAPSVLLRNVDPLHSMAGIVNVNGAQSPFFILSVSSYGETFAGMLSWETVMPRNLEALFPPYPQQSVITMPIATTTTATTTKGTVKKSATSTPIASVFVPAFHDETVSNHDVRIYRDINRKSVIIYGYWNQTTLVIARDPVAFAEILSRLATTRTQ